jgi:8-oxo-dGTP pyrophosphatase MutT (NUDIX family)
MINKSGDYTKLKKWQLLKTSEEYKTKFFNIEKRSYKLPNGKVVDDYYHINRPNYVLVVAVNSKGEILIERNYRRGVDDFVSEIPAGWIDENESPLDAGIRELSEETGYRGEAVLLGEIYAQPGYMNQKAYVIYVKVDETQKPEIKREEDEDIEIEFINPKILDEMISKNEFKDMGALSAIAMYDKINIQ